MKVINNIKGLFFRGTTYPHGVEIEADEFLSMVASEGRTLDGIIMVSPVGEQAPQVETQSLICSQCGFATQSKMVLTKHMRKEHPISLDNPVSTPEV